MNPPFCDMSLFCDTKFKFKSKSNRNLIEIRKPQDLAVIPFIVKSFFINRAHNPRLFQLHTLSL